MYNWTSDMKRLSITTPETDLVFKITISNEGTQPLMVGYTSWGNYYDSQNPENIKSLTIVVQLQRTDKQTSISPKTITFSSDNELYLPAKTSKELFVEFDQYGASLDIGSYTAKVSYYLNSNVNYGYNGELTGDTPIGQYPFEFKIQNSEVLQQSIAENPQGVNFTAILEIVGIIVILAAIISSGLTYFVISKTNFLNKRNKKVQFFGSTATILGLVFTGIGLYLQLIHW